MPIPPSEIASTFEQARHLGQAQDFAAADALLARILDAAPDHLPAMRHRLDLLLQQGAYAKTLELCLSSRPVTPAFRAMFDTKHATALDQLGRTEDAIALLVALRRDGGRDIPPTLLLAHLHFKMQAFDAAKPLYAEVMRASPAHLVAQRRLVDISLHQGRPQDALDQCQRVRDDHPDVPSWALTAEAKALELLGRQTEATDALRALHAASPGDTEIAMALGRTLQRDHQLAQADALFSAVLDQRPDHLPAWQARVNIHLQQSDLDRALALCDTALAQLTPPPPALLERKAQILRWANRFDEAIQVLTRVQRLSPDRADTLVVLGQTYLENGALQKADQAFADALRLSPQDSDALLGRVKAAKARGHHKAALDLLTDAKGSTPDWNRQASPALILAYCESLIHLSDTADIEANLRALCDRAAQLPDQALRRAFELANRQTLSGVAIDLLGHIAAQDPLSLQSAQLLLKHAHIMGDSTVTRTLARTLEGKLPAAVRADFRVHKAALLGGPLAALATARAELPLPRIPKDACTIGRHLLDAGRAQAAMRYLHLAARTWPATQSVRNLFLHACGQAGHHDLLTAHIDHLAGTYPSLDLGLDRLKALYSAGKSAQAKRAAEQRHASGLSTLLPMQYLELCLACGDLPQAEAAAAALRANPDSNSRTAAHFSASLQGRMLTDLRLYRKMETYGGSPDGQGPDHAGRLLQQFYYPAKAVIDDWAQRPAPPAPRGEASPVPKRIIQYWNTPKAPDDIVELIDGWRSNPGYTHQLFNHAEAAAFIRSELGPRFALAFQKARSPAEESDYFRLCCLIKRGGIYIDADDKRVGGLDGFLALGRGLIAVREPIGAVGNNTLAAPPNHPVLAAAIQLATQSLLANENDGAWFKTGPGLLTRVMALYIHRTDPADVARGITILTGDAARRYIQPHVRLPYKSTLRYWNAKDRKLSKTMLDALGGLT